MKNLKYLLVAALFAPLFMSCGEEEEPNFGPATIEIDGNITEAQVIKGVLTPVVGGTIIAPEGATIGSISVIAYDEDIPVEIATLSDLSPINGGYRFSFTEKSEGIAAIINTLTKIKIDVKVIDGESSSASVKVTFESAAPSPLSAAKELEWVRDGGDATGLSDFGLAYTSNAGSAAPFHAIIKKNANTKLVELTPAQWSSIATIEDLKAAVDAADGKDDYRGIRADATQSYNVVLAVDVDGKGIYKIIHITNAAASGGSKGGTKTVITGQYKDGVLAPADK
jgi:hypothetical protein